LGDTVGLTFSAEDLRVFGANGKRIAPRALASTTARSALPRERESVHG
jgi:hypothetical protein